MQQYEVEIKSLLGTKENAEQLKLLLKKNKDLKLISRGKQLNHYFNAPDNLNNIYDAVSPYVSTEKISAF